MIYLASPYTHTDPMVRVYRFESACRCVGFLMNNGSHVFSPIAHSCMVASLGNTPHDWGFWKSYYEWFIGKCDAIWVLQLDGWKESRGVRAEIAMGLKIGKPLLYLEQEAPYKASRFADR